MHPLTQKLLKFLKNYLTDLPSYSKMLGPKLPTWFKRGLIEQEVFLRLFFTEYGKTE